MVHDKNNRLEGHVESGSGEANAFGQDGGTQGQFDEPSGDLWGGVDGSRARTVKVLFPLPLYAAFDYLSGPDASPETTLTPGTWVTAPFGNTVRTGVVWPEAAPPIGAKPGKAVDPGKLKAIAEVLVSPPLTDDVMDFVNWVAGYTMSPLGSVLRMVMRSGDALRPPAGQAGYWLTPEKAGATPELDAARARLTPKRQLALAAAGPDPLSARDLAEKAGVSDAVVRGLAKAGWLEAGTVDPDPPFAEPNLAAMGQKLSADQARATAKIADYMRADPPRPVLLDGVTGSGKTEVYLEAIADALSRDPAAQVLIMLPEIALTLPFLKRVETRFGAPPAAWHSDLSASQRRRVWRRVLDGNARIVVGARSALFLPFRKLALIVVDEEHEGAYKQEDGVLYQGRDMAVARASRGRFGVVLASATPSLETVVNVDQGRYELARLPSRFGAARLPEILITDLRKQSPDTGQWLSSLLVDEVNQRLAAGEQSLLFLNRRGYAPLTICRKCGHRMKAPHSDTWLVEHRFENRLVCHHTGFSMPKPSACPTCKAVDSLSACGPGIERIAEEAKARWPNARHAVLSSDLVHSASAMRGILDAMEQGEIDILVATQIIAKGHHFPKLTLVGVVDADMGLAGGDLRAGERTFQLLSQVAGRAGRADKKGRVIMQSYQPDADVLKALASGDRDSFLAAEAAGREAAGFPPYGRLVGVLLRSQNEAAVRDAAQAHKAALIDADGVEVWGPAPAPIYRLRGEARIRLLVKARRDVNVQAFMKAWLGRVKLRGAVRRSIDIDPYSFL